MTEMGQFREVAHDVYYARHSFAVARDEAAQFIKKVAPTTPRKRCRICFHPNSRALAHEMLIAIHASSYVRPHRHLGKTETLNALEGRVTALLFDDAGGVTERLPMGPYGSGRAFFYRMPENVFHTIVLESEWFVYLETTSGPFEPSLSEAAHWAPTESDPEAGHAYLATLRN